MLILTNVVMVRFMCREYNIDTKKKGPKAMTVRERVLESRIAVRIGSNPDLAREFGLEISTEETNLVNKNLENKIGNEK